MFGSYNDEYLSNRAEIYLKYDQRRVFRLVFGFLPDVGIKYYSPFRDDNRPGASFQYYGNVLKFTDFADNRIIKGIRLSCMDCVDAISIYHNKSYTESIKYIVENISKSEINADIFLSRVKTKTKIHIYPTDFLIQDKKFWDPYGISKLNLIEDKVFRICSFNMANKAKGLNYTKHLTEIAYAYTDFKNSMKLYLPHNTNRFYTNCTEDDIGGIDKVEKGCSYIVITKSYKDWRVLKNLGVNCIWLQNEGMIPKLLAFYTLLRTCKKIYILFDNDTPGIEASDKLRNHLSTMKIESKSIYMPVLSQISDPADYRKFKGETKLISLLQTLIC